MRTRFSPRVALLLLAPLVSAACVSLLLHHQAVEENKALPSPVPYPPGADPTIQRPAPEKPDLAAMLPQPSWNQQNRASRVTTPKAGQRTATSKQVIRQAPQTDDNRRQPPPNGEPERFGRGRTHPFSAARTPISALAVSLKLSANQKIKIQAAQTAFEKQREILMPPPGSWNARPTPEARRTNFEKMRAAQTQADNEINAFLTEDQQKTLAALLEELTVLRIAGIPAELYGDLNLTVSQRQQIAAIGKQADQEPQQIQEKVTALLAADQQKEIRAYQAAHPRPLHGPGEEDRPRPDRPGAPLNRPEDAPPPPGE